MPCDHGFSPGNTVLDIGCGVYIFIQDNGQPLVNIGTGDSFKDPGTFTTEFNAHLGLLELVKLHPGIG